MTPDLFDILPVGLLVTDVQGRIERANGAAARALGLPPDALVGRDVAELTRSPGPRLDDHLGGDGDGHRQRPGWQTTIRVDGPRAHRRVTLTATPIPDLADWGPGFMVEVRDASMQRRARIGRREAEQQLRDALDASMDAFLLLDGSGGAERIDFEIIDLNRLGTEFLGVERGAAVGATLSRLLPPALETALHPTLEGVYLTGDPADTEVDVWQGGRLLVLHLQVVATATGLAVTFRDVTDLRLADRRRQGEERIANAIFEGSPIGIQVFDATGTSERMNEAQLRLLGLGGRHSPFNILHDPLAVVTGEAGAFARAYRGEVIDEFEYDVDLGAPENVWSARRDKASFTRTVFPLLADDGSVTGVVSFLREITERKRLERRLGFLAYHDPLTDLANRDLFSTQLAFALRARRPGFVAFAFVDLDDFKRVNDHRGHAAGDALLCHVANALTAGLREGDLAARLGGDEFGVLLDDVPSESSARRVIDRLVASVTRPVVIGGAQITASASVGLVLAVRGSDPEAVIRAADRCMYAAKADGKGRIHQRSRPLRPRVQVPATPQPTRHRRRIA